jgi:hypothetical protein
VVCVRIVFERAYHICHESSKDSSANEGMSNA